MLAFKAARSFQAMELQRGSVQDNSSHIRETTELQAAKQPLTLQLSLLI